MAELDQNIPLNFLSGKYSQNYWEGSPLTSVMDTYLTARKNQQLFDELERKKQAYKNVASARKGVESKYNEQMFSKAESAQLSDLDNKITAKQAELDAIDAEITNLESQSQELVQKTPVAGAMYEEKTTPSVITRNPVFNGGNQ